jgi:hypothetical protein
LKLSSGFSGLVLRRRCSTTVLHVVGFIVLVVVGFSARERRVLFASGIIVDDWLTEGRLTAPRGRRSGFR